MAVCLCYLSLFYFKFILHLYFYAVRSDINAIITPVKLSPPNKPAAAAIPFSDCFFQSLSTINLIAPPMNTTKDIPKGKYIPMPNVVEGTFIIYNNAPSAAAHQNMAGLKLPATIPNTKLA